MQRYFLKFSCILSSPLISTTLLSLTTATWLIAITTQAHLNLKDSITLLVSSWILELDLVMGGKIITMPLLGLKSFISIIGSQALLRQLTRHPVQFPRLLSSALGILLLIFVMIFHGRQSRISKRDQVELALILDTQDGKETVHAIPQSLLQTGDIFTFPDFTLKIERSFPNSEILEEFIATETFDPMRASDGAGIGYAVLHKPRNISPSLPNLYTCFVRIKFNDARKSSIWLVSTAMSSPQSFTIGAENWKISLRPFKNEYDH